MNAEQRLNIDKMVSDNNVEETTNLIRKLKHSKKIYEDVNLMCILKKKYSRLAKTNKNQYKKIILKKCSFLYNNYTNIFNRLFKNKLDVKILYRFLSVLKKIEDGKVDQHDGSYEIGTILKELYIDSVLRQDKQKNDKKSNVKKSKKTKEKKITWSEFKKMKN